MKDDEINNEWKFITLVERYELLLYQNKGIYFELEEFESITFHYIFHGKHDEALQVIDFAEKCYPESTELMFVRAKVLLDAEKFDQALELLDQLEAEEPEWSSVNIIRGKIFLMCFSPEKAKKEFDAAIKKEPEEILDMAFNITDFYLDAKELDYAIDFCEQNVDNIPADGDFYLQVASCYEMAGKIDKAEYYLEKSLDEAPFNLYTWLKLGRLKDNEEQYEEALEAYDFALTIDENFEPSVFCKVGTLMTMGRHTDAIKLIEESINEFESNHFALSMIAECYENMQQFENAIAYYKKSLEVKPDYADAYFGIGSTLNLQGDPENALKSIAKAIELDDGNLEYLYSRGEILFEIGAYEEALELFKQIVKSNPFDADTWVMISYIKEYSNIDEAIEILESSLPFCNNDSRYYCRMAILYYKKSDLDRCIEYLKKSLDLDSSNIDTFFMSCEDAKENEEIKKVCIRN